MPLWTLSHISKLVRYSILLKDQAITNLSVFISLYVTETNSGILVSFDESWLGIMLYIFLSIVMCLSYLSSRFSAFIRQRSLYIFSVVLATSSLICLDLKENLSGLRSWRQKFTNWILHLNAFFCH